MDYIQELLRYSKPERTMICTHVYKKGLPEIRSPSDTTLIHLAENDHGEGNIMLTEDTNH